MVETNVNTSPIFGDEPMDVAYIPTQNWLAVTLNTQSAMALLDADTLRPLPPAALPWPSGNPMPHDFILADFSSPGAGFTEVLGMKEPRAIEYDPVSQTFYVLGFKGGVTPVAGTATAPSRHDLDVMAIPLTTVNTLAPLPQAVRGLGTTNAQMARAGNGDLYVVGSTANNMLAVNDNKAAVADFSPGSVNETGFVTSMIWKVPAGTGGFLSPGSTETRDLNRVANTGQTGGAPAIADRDNDALAWPADLALVESGGQVTKIYVAAFSSDRIGVLTGTGAQSLDAWTISSRIDLNRVTPATGPQNPLAGPRGLAYKPANPAFANDPGARLYVLNRLDNSIAVIDASTDQEMAFSPVAMNDPTPFYIREGRQFLYDAKISGSRMVSCHSCHTDARTDALAWRLGDANCAEPYPAEQRPFSPILGSPGSDNSNDLEMVFLLNIAQSGVFTPDKREMVTQSLQGLTNFEVNSAAHPFFDNAPHHWRGDKPDFLAFNEAFVTLMGANDVSGAVSGTCPNGNLVAGLTAGDMEKYRAFIHSVHYPGNPRQPKNRSFSGELGSPNDLTTGNGSGGLRGLKLFHIDPMPNSLGGRSCSHCHSLPEGSNNRITVFEASGPNAGYTSQPSQQVTESAALRGLFQLEGTRDLRGGEISGIRVNHTGMNHNGTLGFAGAGSSDRASTGSSTSSTGMSSTVRPTSSVSTMTSSSSFTSSTGRRAGRR